MPAAGCDLKVGAYGAGALGREGVRLAMMD
jgi:hypothetical protein